MVVKHYCYGLYTSESRYPTRLPPGTHFLPFAKPGVIKDILTDFERKKENEKTERAKRWVCACGKKDFSPHGLCFRQ